MECSSARIADELMDFLATKIDEENLQVIRFNNTFENIKIEPSLIRGLVQHASTCCSVLDVSYSFNNRNKNELLDMCA